MGYIGLINSPKTESIQSIQQILSTFASALQSGPIYLLNFSAVIRETLGVASSHYSSMHKNMMYFFDIDIIRFIAAARGCIYIYI